MIGYANAVIAAGSEGEADGVEWCPGGYPDALKGQARGRASMV